MAVCHCGYSRCRYPTTYCRVHKWHGDCIFPIWWPGSGTSCLIILSQCTWRITSHSKRKRRPYRESLPTKLVMTSVCIVSSLASAGSCRLYCFQKQVYIDITIDRYSSFFWHPCFGRRHHVSSYDVHAIWNKVGRLSPILFRNCGIADLTAEYQYTTRGYQLFLQHMTGRDNEPLL